MKNHINNTNLSKDNRAVQSLEQLVYTLKKQGIDVSIVKKPFKSLMQLSYFRKLKYRKSGGEATPTD